MLFGNNMVLQRKKPIPVWGTAEPGSRIQVSLDLSTVEAVADESGRWQAVLPPHEAAEGLGMRIQSGMSELLYTDVAVGEVWIAGGQSNMEFFLGFEANYESVAAAYESTKVRFFDCPETVYEGALDDWNFENDGFWRQGLRDELAYFSAVGFYFAKCLQEDLGVPVGIIGCNYGGTPASAWMDPERLKGTPGEVWLEDYRRDTAALDMTQFLETFRRNPLNDRTRLYNNPVNDQVMRIGLSREDQEAVMKFSSPPSFHYECRPGGLYENMLLKIVPYAVRGVIWYQGETDGDFHPECYTDVFSRLIQNWRALWHEALPFLFVQLAPFRQWLHCSGANYGIVRACQDEVSRTMPNTWMATSGDVGMEWDIHPKNKKPLGERLALLARGHVYGEQLLCDAPEAEKAERDGGRIIIRFRNAQALKIEGSKLKAVQVQLPGGETVPAENAAAEGNMLMLNGVEKAETVMLGAEAYYEVNLFNGAHIPAKPFVLPVNG